MLNNQKKLLINIVSCLVMFLVTLGISFFVTPYITNKVGAEAYGFVSLAINFTSYASIITLAINSMANRFVSISIFKDDNQTANKYFNSILLANVLTILFLGIISIPMIIYLDNIIVIPQNLIITVKFLFSIIFLNFFISILNSSFSVSTYASNHIELYMKKMMEANIIKVIVMVILFILFGANIVVIGIGYLIATIYELIFNVIYFKKFLPMLRIKSTDVEFKKISEVIASGLWNTVTKVGQVLNDGLDLLISNLFLGPLAMGQLSIAKTLSSSVALLTNYLTAIFQPDLTKLYANNDPRIVSEIQFSMKVVSFLSNVLLVGLIVFGLDFYKLWIPTQNVKLIYILTVITITGSIISTSVNTLFSVYTITNKLKVNSLTTLFLGLLNCVVVYICLKFKLVNHGIILIASFSVLIALIKNITFTPLYSAKCLNIKKSSFYPPLLSSVFSSSVLLIIFYFIKNIITINSWLELIAVSVSCGIIGLFISFFIIFSKDERKKVYLGLNKKRSKE